MGLTALATQKSPQGHFHPNAKAAHRVDGKNSSLRATEADSGNGAGTSVSWTLRELGVVLGGSSQLVSS